MIVGGGASGTLLAAQLLRQAREPIDVTLVEPGRVGRGLAYGTPHPAHLLNVPSGRMSALPEEPDHFVRWLESSGLPASPDGFAPRHAYGTYLHATLVESAAAAGGGVRLERSREEATAVEALDGRTAVALRSGRRLDADRVGLALGNLQGPGPLPAIQREVRYVADPWDPGALDVIAPEDAVLIIGTGLTMVDVVILLAERSHVAPILAVSRHGLVPQAHATAPSAVQSIRPPTRAPSLRGWLRVLRAQIETTHGDWRVVVDALRPLTPEAWARLGEPDRGRFLRHLRPYWDVHRHRMAHSVGTRLAELMGNDRLAVEAARVAAARPLGSGFEVVLRPRGSAAARTHRFAWIVNATGPECDPERAHSPLLRQLLRDGLGRADGFHLGLDTSAEGALVDADGRPSSTLYTLGPLRRGRLWETTAIPEIRVQARELAARWLTTAP